MLWEFEDQLKNLYKKFLTNLESVSHDTIEKTKVKAITVMARLLTENCEEEQVYAQKSYFFCVEQGSHSQNILQSTFLMKPLNT